MTLSTNQVSWLAAALLVLAIALFEWLRPPLPAPVAPMAPAMLSEPQDVSSPPPSTKEAEKPDRQSQSDDDGKPRSKERAGAEGGTPGAKPKKP